MSSGLSARSALKLRAIPATSPDDQLFSMSANSPRIFSGSLIAPSRKARWAGGERVLKKPSCSELVSSSPTGLPAASNSRRSAGSTPASPLRPSDLNWVPTRVNAAAQVFILSK